jgi:hypothetical protein
MVEFYTVHVFSVHAGKIHDPCYAMTLAEAEAFVEKERAQYGYLYRQPGLQEYPKIVRRETS